MQPNIYTDIETSNIGSNTVKAVNEKMDFLSKEGVRIYSAYLASKASAEIISKPARGYTFRDAIIEGQRFKGYVGYGDPIILYGLSHFGYRGSVQSRNAGAQNAK